jgi:hypothetical protein
MSITIQAVADDYGHGRSIITRLAAAGFASVRSAPAGLSSLVRGPNAAYRRMANRIVVGSTITLTVIGALIGAGIGTYLAMTLSAHPPTLLQGAIIAMGSCLVGAAAGLLAGLALGLLASGVAGAVRRGVHLKRKQVLLALETDTLASAITAETILQATGAHEIRIGGVDE